MRNSKNKYNNVICVFNAFEYIIIMQAVFLINVRTHMHHSFNFIGKWYAPQKFRTGAHFCRYGR